MRSPLGILLLLLILVLIDLYFYELFRQFFTRIDPKKLKVGYWLVHVVLYIFVFIPFAFYRNNMSAEVRNYLFGPVFILYISKLFSLPILLVDDGRRLLVWCYQRFAKGNEEFHDEGRWLFLRNLAAVVAVLPFVTLVGGIFFGAYRYTIHKVKISLPGLPKGFHGFRFVQISDIHSGSFTNKEAVEAGISKVLSLNPEAIFFTGDLVNAKTEEVFHWMDTLSKLKAPMGVFSILGNHDYGDYHNWDSPEDKKANMEAMYKVHKDLGWDLLRNENRLILRNGDTIRLAGVENWGMKGFARYGKLDKALETHGDLFTILLSHDPSHWDGQIKQAHPEVQLTLSGHTHGMQFGVEIPGWIKWSPSKWVYKQWAGLYQDGKQWLYVNRGFGFIGYPGRVGILPEITLIEIYSAE